MIKISQCDQVTELNELPELETIRKALSVAVWLTYKSDMGMVGITAVVGVKAVVKVMKTFPKCQDLQWIAFQALMNLSCCSIGKAAAIESGGIEVLLIAVDNHLNSAPLCEYACWTLVKIVSDSKENTSLLIRLGGGAAVDKVRTKWPDNDDVQTRVRELAALFALEWKAWDDE